MADRKQEQPFNLGVFNAPAKSRISSTEIVALILSLLWIGLVVLFYFVLRPDVAGAGDDPLISLMTIIAVFLPLAVIWVAAVTARTSREMRSETSRLQTSVEAMRNAYVLQQQNSGLSVRPSMEQKLDQIAESTRQTESAIATFTSTRDKTRPSAEKPAVDKPADMSGQDQAQASLALGTPAEELQSPVTVTDFIKALNFPEDENDRDGFRALRMALQDRAIAKLVRASEDILTLLSHDGIYMDDLSPDRAKPEIWRQFARGERGRSVAALAGIRDRSCLALTAGRMKSDMIFRDAAHHFLRQFDRIFVDFEANATDQELSELAETRTARAFMLLGRVAGTFD